MERKRGDGESGAGQTSVMIVGTRLLQQSLEALLERDAGVRVVGACRAGEAVAMASERTPDVVVMELPARSHPAFSCVPALTNLRPAPRIVLVGRDVSGDEITTAMELGVDACVSEEGGTEELTDALDAVRRSERYIGPLISEILQAREQAGATEGGASRVSLTPREHEILALIAQAKTEPQIAKHLGLSPKTVHAHRTSIMNKLGVHNVIALVRRAIRLGLVDL